MSWSPDFLVNGLVAVIVLAVEAWLYVRSRALVRRDHSDRLALLERRFSDDVRERARRGSAPDWLAYQDAFDRLLEPLDERLRTHAAAALATGLGGTILALIVNLLVALPAGAADPLRLLPGMGVALFGSLVGVGNHLLITLRLLPVAEHHLREGAEEVEDHLRELATENPPAERLAEALHDELTKLREVFVEQLAAGLSAAAGELPEVVRELRGHMDRLAEAVEAQAGLGTAAAELRSAAIEIAESSSSLRPIAAGLTEAASTLERMPGELASVLDAQRDQWTEDLEERQTASRDALDRLLRQVDHREKEVGGRLREVLDESRKFPETFKEKLHESAAHLGWSFGREAESHVAALNKQLTEDRRELYENLQKEYRRLALDLEATVKTVFERLAGQVDETVSRPLREAGEALAALAGETASAAGGLQRGHQEWKKAHVEALEGWRGVSLRVEEAAERLTVGESTVDSAVGSLEASARHLEQVANVSGSFEDDLQSAVASATAAHLDHVQQLVDRLDRRRKDLDELHAKQAMFIRELVQHIITSHGLEVPEGVM